MGFSTREEKKNIAAVILYATRRLHSVFLHGVKIKIQSPAPDHMSG
jgi:hypothetical protein